jgi:GNAT superfamily N-acetyltransferase
MTLREIQPSETRLAHPALQALRPAFADEQAFVEVVNDTQRPEGYRLVGAFEPEPAHAIAAAGFRVGHSLAWGRFLYVDDLSTLEPWRHRGYAQALMDWLLEEARRSRCDQLHLDSGVGLERTAAHRLYLNLGLFITGHHFARRVAR